MVILNFGDHTYTKVRLDSFSLGNLKKIPIAKIEDALTRSLIWKNLWHHVMDMKVTSIDYLKLV